MYGWTWSTRTEPFAAAGQPGSPARVVVEQIGDATFRPHPDFGFQYDPPGGGPSVVVTADSLPETDFASIPGFLSWFVSRHGRHTPAALVHDQLVAPGVSPTDRAAADDLFLEMMDRLDVPPVRRHVMWAAVTLATRWATGGATRVATGLWGLLATAGITLLIAGIATGRPLWVLAALVAPVPASLLWGAKRKAGLVAGFALPPVAFPAAASLLGYGAYWVTEELVRRLRSVPKHQDVGELPTPVAYKEL